jgi:hypothetical protein
MIDRPHWWVPYPYAAGGAENCTLCGKSQIPGDAAGEGAEALMGELATVPADGPRMVPECEPPEGADDDGQHRGVVSS